ncbi:MAG: cell division protein SepF [Clostridia bacterium]
MGLFDSIMRGLGFESDTSQKKEKTKKQKTNKPKAGGTVFNLSSTEEQTKTNNGGIIIQSPKSQEEIQEVISCIISQKQVIVNLSGFNATDRIRSLDFISGACFAIGANIELLEANLYLINK